MESSFSWLDYSDSERRRVMDVVRSLSERNTRDELGVATVRDALADLLAPGITTIQTRIRYFLFVPWIYQRLEARIGKRSGHIDKRWVERQARNAEIELIGHLKEGEDSVGVLGSLAGKSLQRLPSSVYWNGLREWGICLCPWSVDGYHHRLAVAGPPSENSIDTAKPGWRSWHPGLPPAPDDFPANATMRLEPEEAEYLRDRILQQHSGSLLGQLVLGSASAIELPEPWAVLDKGIELPADVANVVQHAREFSLAMHGAVLIYNLMLAEKAQQERREEWIGKYRSMLSDWSSDMMSYDRYFATWDRGDFWQTVFRTRPQVPSRSQSFINAWLDRLQNTGNLLALADDNGVRNLIDNRERQLKKAQARLHNPRLLELWDGATGSGTGRMNYRWQIMRGHLADIHAGLKKPEDKKVA